MKNIWIFLLILSANIQVYGVDGFVKGTVKDINSGELLIGVNIYNQDSRGTTSDLDGKYELSLPAGKHTLIFSYLGYDEQNKEITINENDTLRLDIELGDKNIMLDETVITGSLYEKRASEEVISIEVIKPDLLKQVNPIRFDDIARRIPGLNIVDGQANIRGGSGWSYGVGTRVQVVLDGQTFLSPDRQDVKWTFLPTETIGQIEVLKGASSVLYGSAAMNGTISVQSIKPQSTPQTVFTFFGGSYNKPRRLDIPRDNGSGGTTIQHIDSKWWDNPLMTVGATFMRAHKVSNTFEYLVGINMYNAFLYYEQGEEQYARINANLKWTAKNNDKLSWGLRGSLMYNKETEFFYWQNWYDGGFFKPDNINKFDNIRFYIDPYLTYFGKRDIKHEFKNRIYVNHPDFADKPYTIINSDYLLSKKWLKRWSLVSGLNAQEYFVTESAFNGTNRANIVGIYAQSDKQWDKLSVSGGFRWEFYRYNDIKGIIPPQMRFGLNYNPKPNSFVRFNIGQAFRFPSIAERYVNEDIGVIKIFPNLDLKPEYGFTSEIGYIQKFKSKKSERYNASLDFAFYWQEYRDLVEFSIQQIPIPDSIANDTIPDDPFDWIGFRSSNVPRSRIAGIEATFKNYITINKENNLYFMFSWNYSYPVQLQDSVSNRTKDVFGYLGNMFKGIRRAEALIGNPVTDNLLKYRNRNLITADIEYKWKKLTVGMDLRYWSYIESVDPIFVFVVKDVADFRSYQNYKGNWILGMRGFYTWKKMTFGMIVKNLTNSFYTIRPGKPEAPRSFLFQFRYEL